MEEIIPSFNWILKTNRLINGRLGLDESDLKKIYLSLKQDSKKIRSKISLQKKKVHNQINLLALVKIDSKRNNETINKSFYPKLTKISLLYKKQSRSKYIKARFYWSGKQREVQIGSIPIVISSINNLIENNILENISKINNFKITWKQICKNAEIVSAIKFIGSVKAQEYILRRLNANKMDNVFDRKKTLKIEKDLNIPNQNVIDNNEDVLDELKGIEWYEKWREDNL